MIANFGLFWGGRRGRFFSRGFSTTVFSDGFRNGIAPAAQKKILAASSSSTVVRTDKTFPIVSAVIPGRANKVC